MGDLAAMLAQLAPVLDDRAWQFVLLADGAPPPADAFALIREAEGTSAIIAAPAGEQSFARITLMVHSALDGVGLTAAVSGALAEAGIACNMIAGLHHDHLFVPWAQRAAALGVLQRLSQGA